MEVFFFSDFFFVFVSVRKDSDGKSHEGDMRGSKYIEIGIFVWFFSFAVIEMFRCSFWNFVILET